MTEKWHSETATVQELIDKLKEFPPDLGVAFMWESQTNELDVEKIRVWRLDCDGNIRQNVGIPTVILDLGT